MIVTESDFSDDDFTTVPSTSVPSNSPIHKFDNFHDCIDLDTEYTSNQLPPLLAAVLPKRYSCLFKALHYIKNPTDLAFSATIYVRRRCN